MVLFASIARCQTTYYVWGAQGNDSWSCLLPAPNTGHTDGPCKTLAHAQSLMRGGSIKQTTVRQGTYSIASAFNFTSLDNGETWVPFQGETVIMDGGGASGGYFSATRVSNLTFEGYTLQNMGAGTGPAAAILISGGSGYTIKWNTFLNCYGYCIQGTNIQSSIIDSNTFNGQSPGVNPANRLPYKVIDLSSGSSNDVVSHNSISNAQGGGIDFERSPSDPVQGNNVMDRNVIQNVNTADCDHGAYYAYDPDGRSTGLQITNNYVFNNLGQSPSNCQKLGGHNDLKAFYLDNGVSGATVFCNVCNLCGEWALQINGGQNNSIQNNVFDLSTVRNKMGLFQNDAITQMSGNVFRSNIVYSATTFPSTFWDSWHSPLNLPDDTTNLYYSANGSSIPNGPLIVDANPQHADPQFVNVAMNNYNLQPTSPAYSLINWKTCPTDQGPLPNPFAGSHGSVVGTRSFKKVGSGSSVTH
jgi:Right handed beta helix region